MPSDTRNLFLDALSANARDPLLANADEVDLPSKTVLYEVETPPHYAYFLTEGIGSVVVTLSEGVTTEVGLIGREGFTGSLHLLGNAPVSTHCFTQVPGKGWRVPFSDLSRAFKASDEVRELVLELVQAQTLSLGQLASCNRSHGVEQRLARWLLIVEDRVQTNNLNLTQEFLAQMLGSQRTTVTMAAGALQRAGLLQYRHGQVKITNREGLASTACECYGIIHGLFDSLYRQTARAAV